MFNLGISEVVVILIVALIFLGPGKLPDLARSIGKGMREIKKATDDLKGVWDEEVSDTLRDEVPQLRPPDIRQAARQALDQAWPDDLPGRPGPGNVPPADDHGPDVPDDELDVQDPGGPHLAPPPAAEASLPPSSEAPHAKAPRAVKPAPNAGDADPDPAPDASEPTGGDKHSA